MSPSDSGQMMAQLAQFTSVEQLTKVSSGLDELKHGQDFQASVALIGKTVTFQSDGAEKSAVVKSARTTEDGAVVALEGGASLPYAEITGVQ
jgi:flagellar basal-body rod modification protein FlgD